MAYSPELEARNLATSVNETLSEKIPPHKRTSVIRLEVENQLGRDVIYDSVTGLRIEQIFRTDMIGHRQESLTNLDMLHDLNRKPLGTVAIWLSPPRPEDSLPLGKILVATKLEYNKYQQIVEYDVTGQFFSRKEFADFAFILRNYYKNGYFSISPEKHPWETLQQIIKMDEAWGKMQDGTAEKEFHLLVDQMKLMIQHSKPENLHMMVNLRTGAQVDLACPTGTMFKEVSLGGNQVEHCGNCGLDIHKKIPAGWQCPRCREIYQGC